MGYNERQELDKRSGGCGPASVPDVVPAADRRRFDCPRPDGSAAEVSEASVPASAPVITAVAPDRLIACRHAGNRGSSRFPARPSAPASSNTAVENEAPVEDEAAVAEEPDPDTDAPSAAAWTSQAPPTSRSPTM